MAQTVETVLAGAELYGDGLRYRFVTLAPAAFAVVAGLLAEAADPFTALLLDKDEVTLMMPAEVYRTCEAGLPEHRVNESVYRLITLDVVLEPTLVGLMAHITRALADARISVLPFAAFSRDHIFVTEADFDNAIAVLNDLTAAG